MRRLTIVEGTDGVGKSTLAKKLCASSGAVYRHYGPPTCDNITDEYLLDIFNGPHDQVHDRGFIAEPLWSEVFKRKSIFVNEQHFNDTVELVNNEVSLSVLYVFRDWGSIELELIRRGETDEQIEISRTAFQLYPRLIGKLESLGVHCHRQTLPEYERELGL